MVFFSVTGHYHHHHHPHVKNGDDQPNGIAKSGSKVSLVTDPPEEGREEWGNWFDFILSCIGYAVGLGNVWRFPYLCYENGGGAFLLPYLIMLACCGLPLFFLELSFGQFGSQGTVSAWNISPLFRGVGIGMLIPSALLAIYYNVIIAWTVYYAFKSFTFPTLQWISCDNDWNTEYCFDDFLNTTRSPGINSTLYVRATEEFWTHKVHDLTGSIGEFGGMNWHLLGCLATSWTVVYLCLIKGVKSAGKVVYFTAVFPYVVLVILFFRGVTLPGAWEGIRFYIVPRVADLFAIKPWRDAAVQIFFSLGISFGGLMTFASYNKFHNNCYKDALIVAFTNCGTSIFAGFVIFSTIGFMAHNSGQNVEDVITSGPGLAFIAYPEALARMPGSQFWSFLFFFMLFTLGLDSEFATIETVVTAIVDELPPHRKWWKPYITLSCCLIGFTLGILLVTKSGLYIFVLIDWYSAGFSLMAISATYSLVISWLYGLDRFCKDIECMIGFMPGRYWRYCWSVIAPSILMVIIVMSFVFYESAYYGDYVFPVTAEICGWMMTLSSFLAIPGYMVYAVRYKADQPTLLERLKFLSKPTKEWGPLLDVNRKEAGYPTHGTIDSEAPPPYPGAVTYDSASRGIDLQRKSQSNSRRPSNGGSAVPTSAHSRRLGSSQYTPDDRVSQASSAHVSRDQGGRGRPGSYPHASDSDASRRASTRRSAEDRRHLGPYSHDSDDQASLASSAQSNLGRSSNNGSAVPTSAHSRRLVSSQYIPDDRVSQASSARVSRDQGGRGRPGSYPHASDSDASRRASTRRSAEDRGHLGPYSHDSDDQASLASSAHISVGEGGRRHGGSNPYSSDGNASRRASTHGPMGDRGHVGPYQHGSDDRASRVLSAQISEGGGDRGRPGSHPHAPGDRATRRSSAHHSEVVEDRGYIGPYTYASDDQESRPSSVDIPNFMDERKRQRYRHMTDDMTPSPSSTLTNITDKSYI